LIKTEKVAHKDYLVVDVRNEDFAGGNIKNCLNQPAGDLFRSSVDDLVERTKDVPLVIFHCALSQQRYVGSSRFEASYATENSMAEAHRQHR
jgi:Cdc25 family phosphatase